MARDSYLRFNYQIGRQKPQNMLNKAVQCPFCDRDNLEGIMAEDWPLMLLKNKYPVLEDTFQTVLIETDDCAGEFSLYPKEHLHRLIRFGVKHWLAMAASGEFKSVIFYKNHGPYSGGTIVHPHMQIVGLKNVDYRADLLPEHFTGIAMAKEPGVEFNISTHPKVGFTEFNVLLDDMAQIDTMADYIQIAIHYTMQMVSRNGISYNLFFYQLGDRIAAKVMPRYVTSPLYVGYSLSQVSNRMHEIAGEIREKYFGLDNE